MKRALIFLLRSIDLIYCTTTNSLDTITTSPNDTRDQNGEDALRGKSGTPHPWVIAVVVISSILLALSIAFGAYCICRKDREPLELRARPKSLEAEEDRNSKL